MSNKKVSFGYNPQQSDFNYIAWEHMGTKYNFNIAGIALGVFSSNNHEYLLSQVTSSFGGNCMVGTIDVREIAIALPGTTTTTLISNNDPSDESMIISRTLSTAKTKQEIASGMSIEQTTCFQALSRLGIELVKQDIELSEDVIVCGIEKENFRFLQEKNMGKNR